MHKATRWVKICRMRMHLRAWEIVGSWAVWLMIVRCVAAQAGVQPNPPPPHGEEVQLHAYLRQAAEAMHKGDNLAAAEDLRRALKIDPHSIAALNNLGIVLARMGKPAEAIPLYEEVLKILPDDPSTKRNLAIAYFKAQRYSPAWQLLRPMAATYPADFQILDLTGLSLFALDRYPEAAAYLERANQVDPSDLETLDMLGKAYLRMKDYKELTSVFARIMQVNPNSASAHILMATADDQMSNRPEAIKEYQIRTSWAHSPAWGLNIGAMARTNLQKKNSERSCNAFPVTLSQTAFSARSFWIDPSRPRPSLIFVQHSR
jgi:Flp pilus assembly protein TadD